MSVSSVSSEEMKAEVPFKKQLLKLNFNPEAQEEKDEITNKMGSGIDGEGETKIGWFRYYKAAELILTDVNGEKKTYVQHRWGKIPTPKQHRKTRSLKSPKSPRIIKASASPYGPSPHHLTAYILSSPSATANAAQLTHHALKASGPPKTVNSPNPLKKPHPPSDSDPKHTSLPNSSHFLHLLDTA